ncbi:SAC domain-containing protein [Plasmodiophora brassicae]|uniref:SAC domain-containing protein n=1 Tax=Plasmodiophora brassicae TaxID=37360 RepID=A0A0G4J5X6_PLABS|nr:hypothetical protein PBRA_002736 [Plasmodiophora brassicae]SPQ94887.1 unnamed protein product [Plasmodiophora brassicae]
MSLPPLGRAFLTNITLFETEHCFLLCGTDELRERYRVLHVDYSDESAPQPNVMEYPDEFTKVSLRHWLSTQAAGSSCRIRLRAAAFFGFVQLLDNDWHMHFAIARLERGQIASRSIYQVQETALVNIKRDVDPIPLNMQRYRTLFQATDMSKDFYMSSEYDLTRSMQSNVGEDSEHVNEMYCWNWTSIQNALRLSCPSYWVTPVIHGFFQQKPVELQSNDVVTLTLLCRRSRWMAGTRYQRRGLSSSGRGHVANEVQTELFISLGDSWSEFCQYAAVCLHRGSIPIFWGHDQSTITQPKPEFRLTRRETDFTSTEVHFQRMLDEYHAPIVCVNLIRQGAHKEALLGDQFQLAIQAFAERSRFTPRDIIYMPYDFLGRQKAGFSIDEELRDLLRDSVKNVGFLHDNKVVRAGSRPKQMQAGVIRTNCVDCLDRTNFAQYTAACAGIPDLLKALGIARGDDWEVTDPSLSVALKDLFMSHGDRIANQYAGSGAMHKHAFGSRDVPPSPTEDTEPQGDTLSPTGLNGKSPGKKGAQVTVDQVKDKVFTTFGKLKTNAVNHNAVTAIKRFYSNAVTDIEKNRATQVFLGHFRPVSGASPIWELPNDAVCKEELLWSPDSGCSLRHPWADTSQQQDIIVLDFASASNPQTSEPLIDLSFLTATQERSTSSQPAVDDSGFLT